MGDSVRGGGTRFTSLPGMVWEYEKITPTPPGAGNQLVYVVPANKLYELISVQFDITTNATVGGRSTAVFTSVPTDNGDATLSINYMPFIQPASLVRTYVFQAGVSLSVDSNIGIWTTGLSAKTILIAGSHINITSNLAAGDVINNIGFLVRSYRIQTKVSMT